MAPIIKSSLTARVLSAVAMLGSAQAVNIVCSVVRTKLIAIWLGPVGVGLNAILVNGSTLISTATQLNLRDSAVRDLSLPATPDAQAIKTAVVRRWAILLGLIGALAIILLSPLLSISAYDGSTAQWASFAALAPAVFCGAYSAGEFAVLQSSGRLATMARANVAAGIAATAITIPLLYFLRLPSIVIIINLYALAVAVCARIWRVTPNKITAALPVKTLWQEGKSFLLLGLSISVSMLLTSLMNYVIAAYINSTGGETVLGLYQSGYTLVNSYVGIIFSAIAVEYYPRLTRFADRPATARTLMAHEFSLIIKLVTPVALAFIICSPLIIRLLYSSSFEDVRPFVNLAIIGALYRGVSLCFAYRILAAGDTRAFLFTESLSVMVGLALNIIGYHFLSYTGLGLSYILWYIFYTAITALTCHRRYSATIPGRLWLPLLGATAVLALTAYICY